jgi:hypothetical protein
MHPAGDRGMISAAGEALSWPQHLQTAFLTMKSSAQLGFALQRAAYVVAPLVALAITLVQLVFWFGGQFRLALEERNDQLAAWWVDVLGLAPGNPVTASKPSEPFQPSEPLPVLVAAPAPEPIKRKAKRAKPAPKPAAAKPRPARRARRAKVAVLAA